MLPFEPESDPVVGVLLPTAGVLLPKEGDLTCREASGAVSEPAIPFGLCERERADIEDLGTEPAALFAFIEAYGMSILQNRESAILFVLPPAVWRRVLGIAQ